MVLTLDASPRRIKRVKAANLPVFELVINLKPATALGLNISAALLALGDDVIEQDFPCRVLAHLRRANCIERCPLL